MTIAVVLEIAWASTLKWTDGYTQLVPSLINLALAATNLVILARAMKLLPTALAYSIWTGMGAVGITVIAFWFQGEAFSAVKLACIALILMGVVGLKVFSPA